MKQLDKFRNPDAPASQVAALPWRAGRSIEIMLVSSRETRRWVIPKGWPMKGKTRHRAAEVEALEEAGLEGVIVDRPFGHYHYVKRDKNGATRHCEVAVFPMRVEKQRKNWPEKNQRMTKWVGIEEAAAAVHEPELQDLILAFGEAMQKQAADTDARVLHAVRY